MATEPTNDQRLTARERLERRQARHGYAPTQQTAFNDAQAPANTAGAQSATQQNDIESGSKVSSPETKPADPYADITPKYNKRPEGVKPRTGGSRPVKIHGQSDIMKPSQGRASVTIPLITQNHVGSSQLSFSGKTRNWRPLILIGIAILILLVIIFAVSSCSG